MLKYFDIGGARLPAMEGLRAYAAFVVFFVHATILTSPQIGNGWVFQYLQSSAYGVDLFFLLSGFLITGMVLNNTFNYGHFLKHRLARIYPAFLASIIAYGLFHAFVLGQDIDLLDILANLVFLNGVYPLNVQSISSVTWSLFFEFSFYLVFPVLMLKGTPIKRLAIATLIAIPIIIYLASIDARYARFAMFLVGAWLKVLPRFKVPDLAAAALYLSATTAFVFIGQWQYFIPLFIIPAYLFVQQALYGGGALTKVFSLRPVRIFGNISYSFYLLHPAGIIAARYAIQPLKLQGAAWVAAVFVLGFMISAAFAATSFLAFERPYFTYGHLLKRKELEPIYLNKETAELGITLSIVMSLVTIGLAVVIFWPRNHGYTVNYGF